MQIEATYWMCHNGHCTPISSLALIEFIGFLTFHPSQRSLSLMHVIICLIFPNRIACLASYGTETVMQLCHGRRRCTISADRSNFGSPCRPESRVYLKVVYTCSKYSIHLQALSIFNNSMGGTRTNQLHCSLSSALAQFRARY